MTIEQLKQAIQTVVEYNWADELADYVHCVDENGPEARQGHIFEALVKLDAFCTGNTSDPGDYLPGAVKVKQDDDEDDDEDGEAIGGHNFHDFQRARFTGATTCAKCGLMPMDEEDAEAPCVA